MPVRSYVGAEIDPQIRDIAEKALNESGFSLSEVIRLVVGKIARDKRLPFDAEAALEEEYSGKIPNALTRETIEKAERGDDVFHAKDAADLFRQLGI